MPSERSADSRPASEPTPEVRGLPLLGVAPWLLQDASGFVLRQARRHGTPMRLAMGPRGMVLLAHPDELRHALSGRRPVGPSHRRRAPARRVHAARRRRAPMLDDVARLEYGSAVLREVLRLYPRGSSLASPSATMCGSSCESSGPSSCARPLGAFFPSLVGCRCG